MKISELEKKLSIAKAQYEQAIQAFLAPKPDGQREGFKSAHSALLLVERELAVAKGEEYAVSLEFPVAWDTGAPLPHLIANDNRAYLTFYVSSPDPEWDGTYVNIKDPKSWAVESLALVEFKSCISAKLGSPNEEVFEGHWLAGRGLERYTGQLVKNSRWLAELESINSVHSQYNPDSWRKLNHYIFWFHDSTFECIAESYSIETFECTMPELLEKVMKRL